MSNVPSYGSSPLAPSARLSAASVTSLVLGILFCIPLVTSIAAIIFGAVGIRATRNPMVRGKGMAIAGFVLGIVGVVIWGGICCFVLFLIGGSAAPRATLHDFADNITSGNVAAASAECTTAITPAELNTLHTTVAAYGTYIDITCYSINMRADPAGEVCELSGRIRFASGIRPFSATLIKDGGTWKIEGFFIY